jgi:hypothetical protein
MVRLSLNADDTPLDDGARLRLLSDPPDEVVDHGSRDADLRR